MRQNYTDASLIIIDNGSTDGSIQRLRENYPLLRIVEASRNIGFAQANNIAFRLYRGKVDFFALLNPDAYAEPGWLSALMEAAADHPEYASFGSRCYSGNNMLILDGVGDSYNISGLAWRKAHGFPNSARYNYETEIFSPCAAAALYRSGAIYASGGFDKLFYCYFEDVDLGFRMRLLGYKSLYVPKAVVIHEGSGISGQRSDFQIYFGHRNIVWTYFKNMPLLLLLLSLPLHLAINAFTILMYILRGKAGVILMAKYDAIRGLQDIIKNRHKIQAKRKVDIVSLLKMFAW
jgi:GT2 family glycosyltransferase